MAKKSILSLTLSKLFALLFFLLILAILNTISFNSKIINLTIAFLNQNIGIIIFFSLFLYLGELFNIFIFPINLPAPVFNAMGGIFLASFIFNIFYTMGLVLNNSAFNAFKLLEPITYIIIFLLVTILGYIKIFSRLLNTKKKHTKKQAEKEKTYKQKSNHPKKENIEWDDVGEEFKHAMYNLASAMKTNLEPNKTKIKKKKKKKKK